MHTLRHVWMKTYLQMKRLVSAQAMPLGLSPGSPRSWSICWSTMAALPGISAGTATRRRSRGRGDRLRSRRGFRSVAGGAVHLEIAGKA